MRYDVGRFRRPMRRGAMEQMVSLISLGDGSTLSLDFTTGVLDPRLTFTRASGGTYVGPDGFIYGVDFATSSSLAIGTGSKSVTLTATAGVNRRYEIGQTVYISNGANNMSGAVTAYSASTQVLTINAKSTSGSGSFTSWTVGNASPRFDYDPTSIGTPRGLLIEGTATNLAANSNLQSAWLGGSNTTVTANTSEVLSPDGTNNAAKVALTNSGYCSRFESITGLAASTTYTFSYYIRGTAGNQQRVYSVTAGADLVTQSTLTYSTSGWTRIQITFTTTAAVSNVYIYVVSRPTGTASDVIYIYGAQLEAGNGASSLIPTGASTGQRLLDSCYIAGSNFTSWFSTGAGTVVAQSDNTSLSTSGAQNLVGQFSDSTSANYIRMGYRLGGGTTELLLTSVSSSIQGAADSTFTPALNTAYKSAYAWNTNDFGCCVNGGTVGTDTAGTVAGAGVITSLTIGGDFYQTSGPNSIYMKNGRIRSFKYWPTRLPNATLQALTL